MSNQITFLTPRGPVVAPVSVRCSSLAVKKSAQPIFCVMASAQVSERVYFPLHVHSVDQQNLLSTSSKGMAEALYDNAMRFLDKMRSDESLQ